MLSPRSYPLPLAPFDLAQRFEYGIGEDAPQQGSARACTFARKSTRGGSEIMHESGGDQTVAGTRPASQGRCACAAFDAARRVLQMQLPELPLEFLVRAWPGTQ